MHFRFVYVASSFAQHRSWVTVCDTYRASTSRKLYRCFVSFFGAINIITSTDVIIVVFLCCSHDLPVLAISKIYFRRYRDTDVRLFIVLQSLKS